MKYVLRIILLFFVDIALLIISGYSSFAIINNSIQIKHLTPGIITSTILFIIFSSLFLKIFKSYQTLWRYSELYEIIKVFKSITLSSILNIIIQIMFFNGSIPISLYFLLWMTSIIFLSGFRIGWMIVKKLNKPSMSLRKRALIIGAGEAGSMVVKQLIQSNEAEFYPIGFVDDDHKKQKLEVSGFPVLGRRTDIPNIVKKYDISTIIVAIPSAPKSQIKEIVHICKQTKAHIQILPRLQDLIHGRISVKEIRGVDVKDLLGRDMVKHRIDQLNNYLQDRVVLVTGAGGSIGSELAYQVAQCDPKMVLLLGHGENSIQKTETKLNESMPRVTTVSLIVDIQDQMLIDDVFNRFRPEVVFHAAAHKHVPLMEKNEVAAIKNNVFGTKIVAEAADRYEVKRFVFISTDKAVNPVNIMGMTKRLGELLIQQLAAKSSTKFSIVRFGNVLESRGSVVPIFKRQIAMGGPVTVTHPDMVRYFMTIPEAVQLVLEAGSLSSGGEIFVLNMGEPVKIVDLAKTLIRLSGYEPDYDIKIEYTGIRPGEKLSESLFYNDERSIPSKHPDISIASTMSINYTQFQRELKKLEVSLKNSSDDFRNTLLRIIQNVSSTRV